MQSQKEQLIEGRYALRKIIRSHGAVELYAGRDLQLDRPVMVQMLAGGGLVASELARAFLRHQQIASSIHNCPLLAVYDAGTWEGKPFSVMESEKGSPASALYRPGYPPDVPAALRITRQAAEALKCCREAGLTDWIFAPEAVSIDTEGNGCLAIIEGLEGPHSSSDADHDAAALGGLLHIMLVGSADAGCASAEMAVVPNAVIELLGQMVPGGGDSLRSAGEVARAIAAVELASYQPTQTYEAQVMVSQAAGSNVTIALPIVTPTSQASEAPTLAAEVAPAGLNTIGPSLMGYVPPKEGARTSVGRPGWLPLLALLSVLLLVVALLMLALPRLSALRVGSAATPATQAQKMAQVGDLHGKTLDDARNAVGEAGLNLSLGDPLHDPTFPFDTVARQEPEPGVQIQAGSLVTVSLSLGPETPPTIPAPKVAPAPKPPGKEKKKDNNHDKGGGDN